MRCSGVVADAITAAGVGARARVQQCGRDPFEIVHHHVEHDRLPGARQRRPVEILVGAVAGREDDGAVDAAQRRRNRRRRERRESGGDAGNDAERHAGGGERHRLLAAAAEHERIAALEPQHAFAGARQRDQPLADVGLRRRRLAAALAGKFEPRLRAGERQDARVDQRVVHDHVGLREPGERVERQQAGIARPGAGEPDMARREHRNARCGARRARPMRSWRSLACRGRVTIAAGRTKGIGMAKEERPLRRGWTTGACAAAAAKAAFAALLTGEFPDPVEVTLPRGERPTFALAMTRQDDNAATAGVIKDAGDDPDVTHGALDLRDRAPGAPAAASPFGPARASAP